MEKELTFKEMFEDWMISNDLVFKWVEEDTIEIPGFGMLYVLGVSQNFGSAFDDKVFISKPIPKSSDVEMILNLPISADELMDDEVYYVAVKWGNNFYYIDLREDIDLKILKYIGKAKTAPKREFVNLGMHSPFELLNGSFMPSKWIEKAKFLSHKAIGICDKNTLAGTFILQKECDNEEDFKHIFGYSLDVNKDKDARFGGKIYCLTDEGWANMLRIQKHVMIDNYKDPHITIEELKIRGKGNCFVFDKLSAPKITKEQLSVIKKSFDQVYYQFDVSEYKADRFDKELLEALDVFFCDWDGQIPPVLICDNYYLDESDAKNKAILNKLSSGTSHKQSSDQFFKSETQHVNSLVPLFKEWDQEDIEGFLDEIFGNTVKIANAAHARVETGALFSPEYEQSEKEFKRWKGDNHKMFLDLIENGFKRLTPKGKAKIYRDRLEKEIYVIEATNNVDYFLLTRDGIGMAHENNIQCGSGRGSAAGCLVSYYLDIITIDPVKYDLIFERFLTPARCGLVDQKTTIVGDDIEADKGEEAIGIELEDGSKIMITADSEVMVNRGGEKVVVEGRDIEDGDDILFDRRDELYEYPNITY